VGVVPGAVSATGSTPTRPLPTRVGLSQMSKEVEEESCLQAARFIFGLPIDYRGVPQDVDRDSALTADFVAVILAGRASSS